MNAKVVLGGLVLGESPQWHDGRLWVQTAGTDRGCYACPQGGAGGTTLFIATAQWPGDFRAPAGQVLAVEVTVPGARPATAGR
jgi:hypothetical protein